jgi:uncharacterized membrane protein
MNRPLKRLQATIIAGLFFLLPFVVVGYIVVSIYGVLHPFMERLALSLGTGDLMIVRLMVVGSMLLVCLLAGMLVRWSIPGRLGRAVDENLVSLIPGYDALRMRIGSSLGRNEDQDVAVLIRDGDMWCPARLIERGPDDECVVFVPDSPAGTSGAVIVIASEHIRPLSISYGQLLRHVRNGGRGLAKDLQAR